MLEKGLIIQSVKWATVSQVLSRLCVPITNIILARLLDPETFGLIASLSMVTALASILAESGFQKFLIQHEFGNRDLLEKYTNVVFWTNIFLTLSIWLFIVMFSEKIACLIGSEGYGFELSILALTIPLNALAGIPRALYMREFKFKQLVPINFFTSLVPLFVVVPMAIILKNVWAIIIGELVRGVLLLFLLMYRSSWLPSTYYNFLYLRNIFKDCLLFLSEGIVIWITSYTPTFVVNTHLDIYYTGLFKTAFSTILPYLNMVFTIVSPVLFSSLSRLQNLKEERDKVFYECQKYTSYLLVPIGVGIYVYADLVTTILLGKDWLSISNLIGYLGISFPFSIVIAQYNSVYFRANGHVYLELVTQLLYGFFMYLLLLWAVSKSFGVLCLIGGLVNIVYAVISGMFFEIFEKVRFKSTIRIFIPPIVGSLIAAIIASYLQIISKYTINGQLLGIILYIITYVCTLLVIPVSRKAIMETKYFRVVEKYLLKLRV